MKTSGKLWAAVAGWASMSAAALAQEAGEAAAEAAGAEGFDWVRVAYPLGLGLAAAGSAVGLGRAIGSAMEAMGRQPEALPRIQTAMIIGCAFIEALTIYALISIFLV